MTESATAAGARERLVETAYDLFSRRGIRGVGVDQVIEQAHVAKATFYRHFRSKDDLALAFLERREQRWTRDWVEAEARRRGTTPDERLLAIFDLFDEWFREPDFEACSFINVLLELNDRGHRVAAACVAYLENIRSVLRALAGEAGITDVDGFARTFHILMKGSIVSAAEGDVDAAKRARRVARLVIEQFRTA